MQMNPYVKRTEENIRKFKWCPFNIDRYIRCYKSIFAIQDQPFGKILEIGINKGNSLLMWRSIFPEAEIHGIDIRRHPVLLKKQERMDAENIHMHIPVNQSNRKELGEWAEKYGPFDFVVDDGSHIMSHQIASFETLWPHVNPRGVYAIEDIGTSYWPKYIDSKPTCVEYFMDKIHGEVNKRKVKDSDIFSIKFNKIMIVIWKQ